MKEILLAVVLVAAIGLFSGLLLAIASAVMAVPKDQKTEDIRSMLPGANCGACGFSGCDGYAKAISEEKAKPGLCTVGGAKTSEAISAYLGVSAETVQPRISVVHCLGSHDNTSRKYTYEGIKTCAAASQLAGSPSSCRYGCIGFGDCAKMCRFNALSIRSGVAMVDSGCCTACGLCIKACPKGLLSFVPAKKQAVVLCRNCEKGIVVNKICKTGCIGCMRCEKACRYEAIKVTGFLASVNPEKCIGCGDCVTVCPRHIIGLIDQ